MDLSQKHLLSTAGKLGCMFSDLFQQAFSHRLVHVVSTFARRLLQ